MNVEPDVTFSSFASVSRPVCWTFYTENTLHFLFRLQKGKALGLGFGIRQLENTRHSSGELQRYSYADTTRRWSQSIMKESERRRKDSNVNQVTCRTCLQTICSCRSKYATLCVSLFGSFEMAIAFSRSLEDDLFANKSTFKSIIMGEMAAGLGRSRAVVWTHLLRFTIRSLCDPLKSATQISWSPFDLLVSPEQSSSG